MSLVPIKTRLDNDYEEVNGNESNEEFVDWKMPIVFNKARHISNIEGINCITQSWRMKERVRHILIILYCYPINYFC